MKTITQKEEQHAAACCSETKNRYICISEESEGACTDTLFETLPVLTMDGCQSSELYCKAYKELRLEDCGINEIRENALYHITPDYSISMLDEWRKSATDICYLAEVTPEKADYINGLLRMRVVDEIILYTLPFIAGTGKRFFQSALPQEQWTLTSQKVYRNGVVRHIYKACV